MGKREKNILGGGMEKSEQSKKNCVEMEKGESKNPCGGMEMSEIKILAMGGRGTNEKISAVGWI